MRYTGIPRWPTFADLKRLLPSVYPVPYLRRSEAHVSLIVCTSAGSSSHGADRTNFRSVSPVASLVQESTSTIAGICWQDWSEGW